VVRSAYARLKGDFIHSGSVGAKRIPLHDLDRKAQARLERLEGHGTVAELQVRRIGQALQLRQHQAAGRNGRLSVKGQRAPPLPDDLSG